MTTSNTLQIIGLLWWILAAVLLQKDDTLLFFPIVSAIVGTLNLAYAIFEFSKKEQQP